MIDKLNKSVKSYLTKKMIGITNHFFVPPVISPVVNDVNIGDVIILFNGVKVNKILSTEILEFIYTKIRKEINKFIKSKL